MSSLTGDVNGMSSESDLLPINGESFAQQCCIKYSNRISFEF